MAGHSSWWSMASLSHSHQQQSSSTTSTTSNDNSLLLSSVMGSSSTTLSHNYIHNYNLELPYQPQSWSQLLVSGILGGDHEDQERNNAMKLENWQHQYQILNINSNSNSKDDDHDHLIKQEISQRSDNNRLYNHGHEKFHQDQALLLGSNASSWSINSNNNGVYMDFSGDHDHFANRVNQNQYQQHQHQFSPESSSTATASGGGPCKKARVRPSSTQPPPKVRKEKLGDRITTLHQLVSPFGKTDTASVLLEAIGYIRFLHSQIEALSSPYMKATSSSSSSSNNFMRRIKQTAESRPRNLRSRGLCLVPLSCTQHVDNNNGALYWPSTIDGGF